MAPAYAVSAMLKDADLKLQDFDFYEIHEAFAAQTLCTLKAWESAEFCREQLGRDGAARRASTARSSTSRAERRDRPSVRGDRHAHRRDAREAARHRAPASAG